MINLKCNGMKKIINHVFALIACLLVFAIITLVTSITIAILGIRCF